MCKPIVVYQFECVNSFFMKFPEFSQNLRKARANTGKTQLEVATMLGIREGAYQHYEYGKREPDLKKFRELCKILNVSADFLLGITNETTPTNAIKND